MTEAPERLTAYLQRRKAYKQTDYEFIHVLDVGSEHECALLASDIEAMIAAVAAARKEGMLEAAGIVEAQGKWMQDHNLVGNGFDLIQQGKTIRAAAEASK